MDQPFKPAVMALAALLACSLPLSPHLYAQTTEAETAASYRAAIDAFYPVMVQALNEKEFQAARDLCHKAIAWEPAEPVHYYNLACIESQDGQINLGLAALSKAADLGYANAEALATDVDLANLRSEQKFNEISLRIIANSAAALANQAEAGSTPAPAPAAAPEPPITPTLAAHAAAAPVSDPAFSISLRPETQPATHKVTKNGVTGLFLMTRFWSGSSLEISVWYFAPDGMAYENPAGGFSPAELAQSERSARVSGGGDKLTFAWSDGKTSEGSYEPNLAENTFYWDGGSFVPVRGFTDPAVVAGSWQGGFATGGSSVAKTLVLNADGSFSLTGSASLRSETSESVATAGSSGGGTTGSWTSGIYSVTLTAGDGKAKRGIAFPYNIKGTPDNPDKFYFDGIMWSRM